MNNKTKRGLIKQLLNRKTNIRVNDYVRKINRIMNKNFGPSDITKSLKGMARELKLVYGITDHDKIFGFTY